MEKEKPIYDEYCVCFRYDTKKKLIEVIVNELIKEIGDLKNIPEGNPKSWDIRSDIGLLYDSLGTIATSRNCEEYTDDEILWLHEIIDKNKLKTRKEIGLYRDTVKIRDSLFDEYKKR